MLKPPQITKDTEVKDTEIAEIYNENAKDERELSSVIPKASASIRKRKFSFKYGKLSVKEVSDENINPDNIYLDVEGREIVVEESILTSNSKHISRVLEDVSENLNSEYLLTDEDTEEDNPLSSISYETVVILTEYIAKKSSLNLSENNVGSFQHVARLLGVASVEKLCKKFVKTGLTTGNCLARFALADSFLGWADTANIVQTFIEHNFSEIISNHKEEFLTSVNEIQLKKIVGSNDLHLKSEDEVAGAVLAWIDHDPEARQHCLVPLLEEVQLTCLSSHDMVGRLADHPLVQCDPHCMQIVEQAASYHSLSYQDKVAYWATQTKPGRWPKILVALSYAEKTLEYYDFQEKKWDVLTEKPDWVFGAEMVSCGDSVFTVGGVSSRQVDRYEPENDTWTDGSYPSLRKARLAHGVAVTPSKHGGIIFAAGGSPEVGGTGHCDMEWVEPGIPSECDCTLCGPTDHIKWDLVTKKMTNPRTFTAMACVEVAGESIIMMVKKVVLVN